MGYSFRNHEYYDLERVGTWNRIRKGWSGYILTQNRFLHAVYKISPDVKVVGSKVVVVRASKLKTKGSNVKKQGKDIYYCYVYFRSLVLELCNSFFSGQENMAKHVYSNIILILLEINIFPNEGSTIVIIY